MSGACSSPIQRHVGHDVGIAGDVDHVALAGDHVARLGSGIDGAVWPDTGVDRRGMHRVHHRHRDPAEVDRAALVDADGLDAVLLRPPFHQIEDAEDGDAELGGETRHLARVVAMAVGQQDVGRALDRLASPVVGEGRVAVEPRVDQQHLAADLEAE